jgi:hypothetical protein
MSSALVREPQTFEDDLECPSVARADHFHEVLVAEAAEITSVVELGRHERRVRLVPVLCNSLRRLPAHGSF